MVGASLLKNASPKSIILTTGEDRSSLIRIMRAEQDELASCVPLVCHLLLSLIPFRAPVAWSKSLFPLENPGQVLEERGYGCVDLELKLA